MRSSSLTHRLVTGRQTLVLLAALGGCGPAPAPENPTQPAPSAPSAPASSPALRLPSRAVPPSQVASFLGRIDGKRLYLVGGERWLIDDAGRLEREEKAYLDRAGAPLALWAVARLQGGAGMYAAWSETRVFGFEDILGAPKLLVESEAPITRVRGGPGSWLVFTASSVTALEPRTGAVRTAMLPAFPTRDAIFLDDKRGVADTLVGGVATTTDGGATWRPLRHEIESEPTHALYTDDTDVYLTDKQFARTARIDLATGELGSWGDRPKGPPRQMPPLERWITRYGNPLPLAIRTGIDAGNATGIIAGGGLIARVDLGTGAFVETAENDLVNGSCQGAMSGKEAYLLCAAKVADAITTRLLHVTTKDKLEVTAVKDATFVGSQPPALVGAPGGGLVVRQACEKPSLDFCARQPDGTYATVAASLVAHPGAIGPLADGRVASVGVRALGDERVVELVGSSSRERAVLAEARLGKASSIELGRPEEGADGVIRFVGTTKDGGEERAFLFERAPGKAAFDRTALPELDLPTFADGVLVGVTKEGNVLRASHDQGATFRDLDMPKGLPGVLQKVNRLGVTTSLFTRVGWEPLGPAPAPSRDEPAVRIKASPAPPARRAIELGCKTQGAAKTGPVLSRFDAEVFTSEDGLALKKRIAHYFANLAVGPTDMSAHLTVDAKPDVRGFGDLTPPEKWTFTWIDGREVGAKPHTAAGKAVSSDFYPRILGAWSLGGKMFLSVEAHQTLLLRSKGAGFETIEVPARMAPLVGAPFALSADGTTAAYLAGELLVLWKSGEAPRPVAMVNHATATLLGAPTKEGIPVLVEVDGETYYRVFPHGRELQKKPGASVGASWISASWEGWTRSPSLFTRPEKLSFCDGKPTGTLFRGGRQAPSLSGRVTVNGGAPKSLDAIRYDIVSDGTSMCVESLSALLREPVPSGGDAESPVLDVLRVESRGKKADLTHAGRVPSVPVQPMTCEIATTP